MNDNLLIFLIIFFAIFVQTASGFGMGLIGMPLLTTFISLSVARPLISLLALFLRLVMLIRYREALTLGSAWRLIAGALVGIPFGFLLLRQIDGSMVQTGLGIVVTGYALYALVGPKIPKLEGAGWAYGLGLTSGILSGAYNTGGPPVIIYAAGQGWSPERFKGNLQGFTLVNSLMVNAIHLAEGNFTGEVMNAFIIGIAALVLGMAAGFTLDRYIDPALFRRIVLVLLLILGLTLLF